MRRFLTTSMTFLALSFSSCSESQPGGPATSAPAPSAFVLGVSPEQDIFRQHNRYEPLAEFLAEGLGIPVTLQVIPDYGDLALGFRDLQLDGAFLGSFPFLLAHEAFGVKPIARPQQPDGKSTYHGTLLVRKDSGIKGAVDMQGKVFAFVHEATTAGYVFPLAYFRANGISDYRRYFRETYFAGTHGDVLADVLNRRADIGAVKSTVLERAHQEDDRIAAELTALAQSPEVPENVLTVRQNLPAELKEGLARLLLTMHESAEGRTVLDGLGANRFVATTVSDYQPLLAYAGKSGLAPR